MGINAEDFDNLGLTAEEFDSLQLTAEIFDNMTIEELQDMVNTKVRIFKELPADMEISIAAAAEINSIIDIANRTEIKICIQYPNNKEKTTIEQTIDGLVDLGKMVVSALIAAWLIKFFGI